MFPNSPNAYIKSVVDYSRQETRNFAFRPVADFLEKGAAGLAEDFPDARKDCCLWFHVFYLQTPTIHNAILSRKDFWAIDADSTADQSGGRLLFLRGYPSPKWLALVGHLYRVHPEYWRRHLGFLFRGGGGIPSSHVMPSASDRVFRLRVGTIGTYGRRWRKNHSLEVLQRDAAKNMEDYLRRLADADAWKQGDSVVRQYTLHDEEHFTIEQNLTVYLHLEQHSCKWTVIVFLDSGDDLATSPAGPWINRTNAHNNPMMVPKPPLSDIKGSTQSRWFETTPHVDSGRHFEQVMWQSMSAIHVNYGESLDPQLRMKDPFYLLSAIFQEDATNEEQILDLIAEKIKRLITSVETEGSDKIDYSILHARLLHYQTVLDNRVEILREKLDLLSRRGGDSWRPMAEPGAGEAIRRLETEFEYLVESALKLSAKLERSTALTLSLANIDEARRGTQLNSTVFRFTLVASFYIPLSFTSSFFGMNFKELGTGNLRLWVYFAVGIPVLLISVLCLFVRRSWLDKISLSTPRTMMRRRRWRTSELFGP
ncbi:hypothetical protein LTR56_002331 [Elasticomyces elasticus]|nr:hypothetical protein LTR56_002331 [Elasticomyces elasticus]KAK3665895.1 hypothetical protein LTR22_003214 [Elasticomyces elasticus]KAK4929367.1 hypothetical protein LTR49_003971 [Elasticomyces elasticus]KAK5764656.1 hypothetical protein LTS12_005157 [Elasticomyces elasticus]